MIQLSKLIARSAAISLLMPATIFAQTKTPIEPAAPSTRGVSAAGGTTSDGPPVRKIESASAVSVEPLGAITNLRQLSDGRILLNDGTRRRLLLLDSTLAKIDVVLDSLTDVQNAYGTRAGALIAYRGDSTLFVDPATYAMLVIDPKGKIVRVRSVPRAQDVSYMSNVNAGSGIAGFDASGRLIYRIPAPAMRPIAPQRSGFPYIPQTPDSALIVGIHLDTRKVDTIGAVRIPRTVYSVTRSEYGFETRGVQNPLPLVDDWAVLADGTIAFVRGRDYRIDYLNGDGTTSSSEKLSFPWMHLTEDDKVRFVDSMKTVQTKNAKNDYVMQMIAWSNLLNKPYPAAFSVHERFELPQGLPRDWILPKGVLYPQNYVYACPPALPGAPQSSPSVVPAAVNGAAGAGAPACRQNQYSNYYGNGYTPPAPTYRAPTLIPANDLPDYKPPISSGSVRADADGNLWIRPQQMKPNTGGVIYDVVNREGKLIDRLQFPIGYALAGFGPGRVVYLGMRDATGLHLARVRLRDR